jgi:peptidyl-tRNA hydrolase
MEKNGLRLSKKPKNGKQAMTIKCWYNRNLKMTPQKLAAQVSHVVAGLTHKTGLIPRRVIVLKASKKKFGELAEIADYIQVDEGLTEVPKGTRTVVGFVEIDSPEDFRKSKEYLDYIKENFGEDE